MLKNIDCGYTLGSAYEYPQSMFWSKNKKKIGIPLHTPVRGVGEKLS